MARSLNVACLQTQPRPDFESALEEALSLADVAAGVGAELIALPEYCGGLKTRDGMFAPPAAVENEHPVLQGLISFARDRKVWMLVGSVAVPGPGERIRNRGFIIDDTGLIRNRYDKIHLFDIQLSDDEVYRESALVAAGKHLALTQTPFANIGQTICYDLRFPGLYRDLAQAGAELLVAPSAFTKKTGEAHWHVLNRARAIENCAFMVSPCAVGKVEGGGEAYGHSLIVNPWGEVLADGGTIPGVINATIDLDAVASTRAKIPSWQGNQDWQLPSAKATTRSAA